MQLFASLIIFRYLQTAMRFNLNILLISYAFINQSNKAQPVYLLIFIIQFTINLSCCC